MSDEMCGWLYEPADVHQRMVLQQLSNDLHYKIEGFIREAQHEFNRELEQMVRHLDEVLRRIEDRLTVLMKEAS